MRSVLQYRWEAYCDTNGRSTDSVSLSFEPRGNGAPKVLHYKLEAYCNTNGRGMAGFLYRAGAETPLNFREKFRVSPRTILENFSAVDTQTAVLVSTAEVWISAPDTQTPIFLGFPGIHSWLWFFCRETKIFGYFPEVPVTKIRVSAPAPYKNPTVCPFPRGSLVMWPAEFCNRKGQSCNDSDM